MDKSILIFLILVFAVLAALVVALILSYRTTRHLLDDNVRMWDLLRKELPDKELENERKEALGRTDMSDVDDKKLMQWIDGRMNQEELFRQSELSLKSAAQELGLTPSHYRSTAKQNTNNKSFNS